MITIPQSISALRDLGELRSLADLWQRPPVEPISMAAVAAWCEALAGRIRAGETLTSAIANTPAAVSLQAHLHPLRLRIQRGMDLVTACTSLIDVPATNQARSPAYWRETLGVIRVCALGTPHTAKALDKVARTLLTKQAIAEEAQTHTASARLSAKLLTALPVGAVGVTVLISPTSARVFTTALGLGCLVFSLALNLAGWLWIRSLLRSVDT
jgi:Flp pilus assembly protein TadB